MASLAEPQARPLSHWAAQVGPLRLTVAFLCLLLAMAAALPAGHEHGSWRYIVAYTAPGLAVILIWALPWDILMARVTLLGAATPDTGRYRVIRNFDLGLLVLLLASWGPFFLGLISDALS